jgi:hypothetical protein
LYHVGMSIIVAEQPATCMCKTRVIPAGFCITGSFGTKRIAILILIDMVHEEFYNKIFSTAGHGRPLLCQSSGCLVEIVCHYIILVGELHAAILLRIIKSM